MAGELNSLYNGKEVARCVLFKCVGYTCQRIEIITVR